MRERLAPCRVWHAGLRNSPGQGDADGDHQQGAGHKCRCVALWPGCFFPGRKSITSKSLRTPSNRASVALLLGYLALLLGHPAHPVETFALSAGPESTNRQYRFAAHAMDFAKFLTLPHIAKAVWRAT